MALTPRSRFLRIGFILSTAVSLAVVLNCGTENESEFPDGAPCTTIYKDKCGTPCSTDENCAAGLFCGVDGKCTAQCAPSGPRCREGVECSPRGRCGTDPTNGPIIGADTGAFDANRPDSCADINLTLDKVNPTVVVLVDQSGSMVQEFPPGSGQTRWDVLRSALIGADGGIIKTLENDVTFGLTLYTWPRNVGACPKLVSVAAAKTNYANINAIYANAAPDDNTPTAESIMGVVGFNDAGVLNDSGLAAMTTPGPKILLLATDGDPDTCADPDSNGTQPPRDFTLWATKRAYDAGVSTYVVAVGAEIDITHQQQVANAGLGFDPNAGDAAPLFRTNDRTELTNALNKIIAGVRSCKFKLNGSIVPGTESQGSVTLNGVPLVFNDPNGWKVVSATEIEVVGAACTTVKTTVNAQINVRFPCGTVVPR